MNDDFDAEVVAWMRVAAEPDPGALSAVRGAIDRLPARKRGRPRVLWAAAAVLTVLAVGSAAVLVDPNRGDRSNVPGGPGASIPSASVGAATAAATPTPPSRFETPGPLGRTWFDANGAIIAPSDILEWQGTGHCGWESTTWLRFGGRNYIRDPGGVLGTHTLGTYDSAATLPADARSTGFNLKGRTIWRTSDANVIYIYIVSADHVERWPAIAPDFGCA